MQTILRSDESKGKPKKWTYTSKASGSIITDRDILEYIKGLVIPPGYKSVEIYYPGAKNREPKVKYMGVDDKGRPQFIYSKWWGDMTRQLKFCTLIKFGKALPRIMKSMNEALDEKKWSKNKVISLVLRVITLCYFRIGNTKYEKLYKSHGISTIGFTHVKWSASNVHFQFIGKKGVENTCTVGNEKVLRVLRQLIDDRKSDTATGSEDPHLFMYKDDGKWHHIKHTDINDWLKKFDPKFTSKLFRTYDTNILLINRLSEQLSTDLKVRKKALVEALKEVSAIVHNTPAICKKDYADPELIKLYIEKPRSFKTQFGGSGSSTAKFITWLEKSKSCVLPTKI